MPKPIKDSFSDLETKHKRNYARTKAKGLCTRCRIAPRSPRQSMCDSCRREKNLERAKYIKVPIAPKDLPKGHLLVAIIGTRGAGKSTLAQEIHGFLVEQNKLVNLTEEGRQIYVTGGANIHIQTFPL